MNDITSSKPIEINEESSDSSLNNDLNSEASISISTPTPKTTIKNSEINKDEVKNITNEVLDDIQSKEEIEMKKKEIKSEKKPENKIITTSPLSLRSNSIISLSSSSPIQPKLTHININASSSNHNSKSAEEVKELARNLSGMNLLPPIETTTIEKEIEEEWSLKAINWPPLPPPPSSENTNELGISRIVEYSEGPVIKVITQNLNGPCSLIALCMYFNFLRLSRDASNLFPYFLLQATS